MSNVGYALYRSLAATGGEAVLAYSAWASALLVRLRWAMQGPRAVGRVTENRLPRFSFYTLLMPNGVARLFCFGYGYLQSNYSTGYFVSDNSCIMELILYFQRGVEKIN